MPETFEQNNGIVQTLPQLANAPWGMPALMSFIASLGNCCTTQFSETQTVILAIFRDAHASPSSSDDSVQFLSRCKV